MLAIIFKIITLCIALSIKKLLVPKGKRTRE